MQRTDLETWFTHHPDSIHTDPAVLLDQCESEVRDHAHRDAWIHAKEIAEESLHRFERVFGLPASDIFVTREVCHEIARELRRNEPHPEDDAVEWVGSGVLEALDSDARRLLQGWLKELAAKEEHSAWREIVYFTDHLARSLIDAGLDVLDISPAKRHWVADMDEPFKAHLDVPVIAVNDMDDPDEATAALREGRCDLVAVGRQMIADARWPKLLQAGELPTTRKCRKCDEGCHGNIARHEPVECVLWDDAELTTYMG